MAGVVLDSTGRPARRDRARIYVPPGMADERAIVGHCWVCQLVTGEATIFREGEEQAWQRHVGECARKHMAAIQAASPSERNRGTVFGESQDPEVEEHLLGIGRRMKRENRWELKPGERAGLQ